MYLFFNGVSSQGYIALLDTDKNIIAADTFQISGNESTQTIPIIDEFLAAQNCGYESIKNIICVVGPGSFTGIRTISLVLNTLVYIHQHISLTPVNFFDLYDSYPIVKSSSKRDLFVKLSKSDIIQVLSNADFENATHTHYIYGDTQVQRFTKELNLVHEIDYSKIIKSIPIQNLARIAPLYIKKPNIS